MGIIRKYNEVEKRWEVVSTSEASTVSVRSEKLLPEGQIETNVEQVLIDMKDDISLMKGNISWLALHGGGGSGGGSGGTVTGDVLVNGYKTGAEIVFDENQNLTITVQASNSSLKWDITASSTKVIKSTQSSTKLVITKQDLDKVGLNSTFQLAVTAYNSDTLTSLYWNGTIYIATVKIETTNINYPFSEYKEYSLNYNYKIGVTGNYTLKVNDKPVWNGPLSVLSGDILVPLSNIEGLTVGSNKITSVLEMVDNANIKSNGFDSYITLTADEPIITCTSLSEDEEAPTEVPINKGATTIILTPYTVYYVEGTYKARIYSNLDEVPPSFDSIGVYNTYNVTYNNASYALKAEDYDQKVTITISIQDSSTNTEYTKNFYIITKRPKYELLDNGQKANLIFDFISYEGDLQNKQWQDRSGIMTIHNTNFYSENIQSTDRSLRLQNASFASITNRPEYNSFYKQITSSNIWAFTLSICYKADFHPDDDRTILQFADLYDENADYSPKSGIVIRAHKLYIGQNMLDLQDRELINLTITYTHTGTDAQGIFGNAFVYIDGVLEAVFNIKRTDIIPNIDTIYLAAQKYEDEYMFYTDVNIYRVCLYKSCLNPYQVLFDYLNDSARTHLLSDGSLDSEQIELGLKRNLITSSEDGNKVSLLWDTTAQFNNNLDDYSNCFTLSNLISISGDDVSFRQDLNSSNFDIPIPMMLIDVSHSTQWNWKNFITPNSGLDQVDQCRFQYFDKTQSNNSIITGYVSVSLQGTSTLADFVKNLNITFADDSVFIPKETWFPEKKYTLKADIVDSSHSLNTSIGKFVNTEFGLKYKEDGSLENTESWYPYSETVLNSFVTEKLNPESAISKHFAKATLKHGVEGFPIFLIMRFNTQGDLDAKSIATLGIYQFILGRDSARNLGYEIITDVEGMEEQSEMTYPYYKNEGVRLSSNLNKGYWIEMNQNDSFPDDTHFQEMDLAKFKSAKLTGAFWQNDNEGSYYNSAASVKYTNLGSEAQYDLNKLDIFKKFVNNVVSLPVTNRRYSVEKQKTLARNTFSNTTYPKYVYKNNGGSYDWEEVPGESNALVQEGDPLETVLEGLNLDSISKYFVIAMFLGLIDNFQKNMPIKIYQTKGGTWENPILGIYDTDTGCGGTNEGDIKVSEDVWLCPITNVGQQLTETSSNNSQKVRQIIGNANKLWYLDSGELNYTWKQAKDRNGSIFSGQWNSFIKLFRDRYSNEAIEDEKVSSVEDIANKYINKYFIPQTEGCGEILFNLTYFSKYLNKYTLSGSDTPVNQYSKLHGRRKNQIKSWLRNRVKFLDSLFIAMGTTESMEPVQITPSTINISSGSAPKFYITSNYPIISAIDSQGSMNRFVLCEKNVDTDVYFGSSSANSTPVSHTISFSEAIQKLGKEGYKLSDIKYQKITSGSVPYLTDFDLSNCTSVEQMNADGMNNFKSKGISELRTIDCSNTAKLDSPINFVLNLTSGFQKLQNINIYNSCVSQLELPTDPNIPLLTFNIIGSQLTSLDLNTQNLLETIDLTNCSRLTRLSITNCEKLKTLKLDSTQSALSTVTISSGTFEELSCVDNNTIKSVSITSDVLKKVVITNCKNLTSVTVSGKMLDHLDLSDCPKLTTLNIVSPKSTMDVLNISNTSLKVIKYNGIGNSEGIMDLSQFSNISRFNIGNNSSVEYIQFKNDLESPVNITYSFNGCLNLKRVYGNLRITVPGAFNSCSQFSIHGTDLKTLTYNGQSVLDGKRVKHPVEISGMVQDGQIVKQAGEKVTNITYSQTNGSYMFYKTSCTTFDIYYTLYNIGALTILNNMFWGLTSYAFEWTEEVDNSPNTHLFDKCGNVTSVSGCFRESVGKIRLFSPTNNQTDVTSDDGLFSPLINCTNVSTIFFSSPAVFADRFVFRRKDGNYSLKSLDYFFIALMVDDVKSLSFADIDNVDTYLTSHFNNCGNFGGFFQNLPSLSTIHAFCDNTRFVNYDTTRDSGLLAIPSGVTTVKAVLRSTYGSGAIVPEELFKQPLGKIGVKYILHSFIVRNQLPSSISLLNVTMNITSDTLAKFNKLVKLGYSLDGDNIDTITSASFTGDGITKKIDQDTFPYDILKSCKSTIQEFCGFFQGAGSDKLTKAELPGTLFEGCTKITNVSSLFNRLQIEYSLTSNSFAGCPNLSNVAYLFGYSGEHLHSNIPARLFYHGELQVSETFVGVDLWDEETQSLKYDPNEITGYDEEGAPIYRGVDEQDQQDPKTITYRKVNANITQMQYCFTECNCDAYINSNPTIENNADYRPWTHVLQNGKWVPVTRNLFDKTFIWEFDGTNIPEGYQGENLDNDLDRGIYPEVVVFAGTSNQGTLNFICAPDLFRYCKNNSQLNITHLFEDSGHNSNSVLSFTDHPSNGAFGIKGRICPYLFKPISANTSIDSIFKNCKQLSYYTDTGGLQYTIPKILFNYTSGLTVLTRAFQGLVFPNKINLDVFKTGANINRGLSLDYIFFNPLFRSNSSERVTIGPIFGSPINAVELKYAFSVNSDNAPSSGNTLNNIIRTQYVTFNKVFERFGKDKDSYVFDGYNVDSVQFINKSLRTEIAYRNYRRNDNSNN